jgi:hypothetical protein
MNGEQYQKAIDRLRLSQVGAAKFFGVDGSTSRRWVSNKHPIPLSVSMLLRAMIKYKIAPGDLNPKHKVKS